MIHGTKHRHTLGAQPVAHGHHLVVIFHLQCQVLHGARGAVGSGITRVSDPHLHLDALNFWIADEGDGAFVVQA